MASLLTNPFFKPGKLSGWDHWKRCPVYILNSRQNFRDMDGWLDDGMMDGQVAKRFSLYQISWNYRNGLDYVVVHQTEQPR